MSTERDVTRIVRSWLNEDRHEDADRVLNTVLDELDTTPQRRSWWSAWRTPIVNKFVGIGLAAVAVVLAAIIGIQLFGGPKVGGPGPTDTPSSTPQASASAPPEAAFPASGAVSVGRHSLTRGGVSFSLDFPTSGWISDGSLWINKYTAATSDGAAMLFWIADPDNVFADPCAGTPLDPPAGPSAADLADAMSSVPGTDLVTGPRSVNVGGRPGQHVAVTVREDIDCAPGSFNLWYFEDVDGAVCETGDQCPRYATALGSTIYVWIVEIDGTRLVIEGETYAGAGPEVEQELQQIVASLQFE